MSVGRIHHLDCCSMCPRSARLINGAGGWLTPSRLVAHCLLIETESSGLVLVDSGISTLDLERPERLPAGFRAFAGNVHHTRPAVVQVEDLGFDPRDVHHIIVTHLDVDHAGGIADFPWATVHVHARELRAARLRRTFRERERYVAAQWSRHESWQRYDENGDRFFGLEAVRPLFQLGDDIALVPMFGHTEGHSAVAVHASDRWLLHCGDAYFHRGEMDDPPRGSPGLDFFQRVIAMDNAQRVANQRRLRQLRRSHGDKIDVFCAHDPVDYDRLRQGSGSGEPA